MEFVCTIRVDCELRVHTRLSSQLVMYMAWCIFILQNKSIVYIFLLINSCMKFVSWIFFFSCTILWHPTSICPAEFCCFLFCKIVSNVGKKWIFWSIQSVMGFGICGHRFRRSPFTNKIFYIYRCALCALWSCPGFGPAWSVRIASLEFGCRSSRAPRLWAPFPQSNMEENLC